MKKSDGTKAANPVAKPNNASKMPNKAAAAAKKPSKVASKAVATPKETAKAAANPPAAPKKSSKKKKVALPALSSVSRQTKVKPPEGYSEMVEDVVEAWVKHGSVLRIEGRSPGRLRTALAKAKRAREKEDALRKKLEGQIRPLSDARIVLEESMWTEVLDLYRVVKAMTPMRPELEKGFEMLTDHFSRPRTAQTPSALPPPGVGILRDADLEDE